MSATEFLYLSQEDVVAAGGTDMAAMVDVIARAFAVKAAGGVRMPPKAMITWADEPGTEELHGRIMAMPAYIGGEFDVAGLKWIPSVPDNPARNGLPRANALVLLTDRATGLPLAVMDGTVVSAMRTGAVTGVALRHLADPGTEVACLLGAGVLAHTQLAALRVVLPGLREVRAFDPDMERCRRFCDRSPILTGRHRPWLGNASLVYDSDGASCVTCGAELLRPVERASAVPRARPKRGAVAAGCALPDAWQFNPPGRQRYVRSRGNGLPVRGFPRNNPHPTMSSP